MPIIDFKFVIEVSTKIKSIELFQLGTERIYQFIMDLR